MSRILFVGHGSPATLIDEDQGSSAYHKDMRAAFAGPPPRALLVLSAHWYTDANTIEILGSPEPLLEYDFSGFDEELYEFSYPMTNDLNLAAELAKSVGKAGFNVRFNFDRGYDHGVWVPLAIAWENAPCPVLQMSLPWLSNIEAYRRIGRNISSLLSDDVWIVGSGDLVHNLGKMNLKKRDEPAYDWAITFERWLIERLRTKNWEQLAKWETAEGGRLSHPKPDHLYPAYVIAGAAEEAQRKELKVFHESLRFQSISMTSFEYV